MVVWAAAREDSSSHAGPDPSEAVQSNHAQRSQGLGTDPAHKIARSTPPDSPGRGLLPRTSMGCRLSAQGMKTPLLLLILLSTARSSLTITFSESIYLGHLRLCLRGGCGGADGVPSNPRWLARPPLAHLHCDTMGPHSRPPPPSPAALMWGQRKAQMAAFPPAASVHSNLRGGAAAGGPGGGAAAGGPGEVNGVVKGGTGAAGTAAGAAGAPHSATPAHPQPHDTPCTPRPRNPPVGVGSPPSPPSRRGKSWTVRQRLWASFSDVFTALAVLEQVVRADRSPPRRAALAQADRLPLLHTSRRAPTPGRRWTAEGGQAAPWG